jgi:hypothetical protein
MCSNGMCEQHPGEAEFRAYQQKLGPNEVIFSGQDGAEQLRRYGVVLNSAYWQWEIVAVERNHHRHVAFVAPQFGLSQALNMADRWTRSMAAIATIVN